MSDTPQRIISIWRRPQVQAIIIKACGASGVIGSGIIYVAHWLGLPAPDLDTVTQYVIMGTPLLIEGAWSWYKNHPDNILAKAAKMINGGAASDKAVAKVEAAVLPPVVPMPVALGTGAGVLSQSSG